MDPELKFVIEASCLTGIVLLGAVLTLAFGKGRWDRSKWLQAAGFLVIAIVVLVVNPRGWPDLFPIVIGFTAFVVAVVGLLLALMLAWRLTHRGGETELTRQAAVDFSQMGLSGVLAAGCLLAAVVCTVWLAQAVTDAWAYAHAPLCTIASSGSCRSQADGIVVRISTSRTGNSDFLQVHTAGRDQRIQIATAHDVWQRLTTGERVELTSWHGHVTAVTVPGGGTMETSDAPGMSVVGGAVLVVVSLLSFAYFAWFAGIYRTFLRAVSAGVDVDRLTA